MHFRFLIIFIIMLLLYSLYEFYIKNLHWVNLLIQNFFIYNYGYSDEK